MEKTAEWLMSLKTGDEVAVCSGGGYRSSVEIRSVERTTPSQIVISFTKYRRANGREVGRAYGGSISPVTQEVRDVINERERRRAALRVVVDIRWHHEPLDVLEAMATTYLKMRSEQPQAAGAVDPHACSTGNPSTRDERSS